MKNLQRWNKSDEPPTNVKIKRVEPRIIIQFVEKHESTVSGLPEYTRSLLDPETVKTLLTDTNFKKGREGYGVYNDGIMVGYVVIYRPQKTMDLLYILPEFRRRGISFLLIKELGIERVVVNKDNRAAVALYRKSGLLIEFDDE